MVCVYTEKVVVRTCLDIFDLSLTSAYEESLVKPVLLLNLCTMLIKKCLRLNFDFFEKIFSDLFLNLNVDSVKVTSDEIVVNGKNTREIRGQGCVPKFSRGVTNVNSQIIKTRQNWPKITPNSKNYKEKIFNFLD
ncbi:unnamed protein product [Meloidogyne enterolobii]|uniref:Uncharacterized protein n=1 Tax=Meloidogyne enterolobii TaxID=390850 RepID=A0ACB0ZZ10_MELEN